MPTIVDILMFISRINTTIIIYSEKELKDTLIQFHLILNAIKTKLIMHVLYLNAKETQPFLTHFFFHMDHMRLIS